MNIEVSKNSLSNRRLFIRNKKELINFSQDGALSRVTLTDGFVNKMIENIPSDIVSEGACALRLESDGDISKTMSFTYDFDKAVDMSSGPMLIFAFSAYDGEYDSKYFKDVAENMYFVEKPDPQLVHCSYITVTIYGKGKSAARTIQLTNYGFNKIFANYSGEDFIDAIDKITFEYIITEPATEWQNICKLDTVFSGMSVDLTFKGSGMECLFDVENGSCIHQNNVITYKYEENSSLSFPDFTDAKDTICDAYLPIKNTFVLRAKADKECLNIKVFFKNEEENFYSDDKSKVFTLTNVSEANTYYLNMSDVDKCKSRLTGIKIVPEDSNGTLYIYKLAFEQEKIIEPSSGIFTECTCDKDNVYFECEVKPEYIGKKLEIYEVYPVIIHENLDELECVASTVIDNTKIRLITNMQKEKTTRIASQFMGIIHTDDGKYVKFSDRCVISNWRDICTPNPDAFDLPELSVSVTEERFGAKGDGYTNDTKAIQAAIDYVALNGGGRVVIPGDMSEYGKRYIVTNLVLRSYVQLSVGENAILWQADDISYYDVLPRFGHNVSMTGVNWPANHSTGNMPMIYGYRIHNFKLTGPGTIRMCDTESASEDGFFKFIGDNVCIGCVDRLHVTPVGITECDNFEVTDLKIIRSSATNVNVNENTRGYFGNLFINESKCTGADGLWPCGSDGMIFTRIILNNNDDGICLSSNYNDPRDVLWVYAFPGRDRGTHNVELSHSMFNCYTFTASAISFCTWGTDAPELDKQEVSGIHIFDTILEGRRSIGGWTDNPYYGKSPFDSSETDDFSPVKDVYIHDCELRSPLGISPLRITNCRNDVGFKSPSDFEYGDFRRRVAERNPGWTVGLSNWSYNNPDAVNQIQFYDVCCACVKPVCEGLSNLYQGLYVEQGKHSMSFEYKAAGTFYAFIKDLNGNYIARKAIDAGKKGYIKGTSWNECIVEFEVPEGDLYHLGVEVDYASTVCAYVTNFHIDKE